MQLRTRKTEKRLSWLGSLTSRRDVFRSMKDLSFQIGQLRHLYKVFDLGTAEHHKGILGPVIKAFEEAGESRFQTVLSRLRSLHDGPQEGSREFLARTIAMIERTPSE